VLIGQAIFTSTKTNRAQGYQVACHSDGISSEDLQELNVWGPSHDSLLHADRGAASYNFFPLPSGAYCVSRTTAHGAEYSGRGQQIYTHNLVVPAEALARFGNNPFGVLRAATATGLLQLDEEIPSRLDPVQLNGRSNPVDQMLLTQVVGKLGPLRMATLVQATLRSERLAVLSDQKSELVFQALVNCLPVNVRPRHSFSTGLRYSTRRPFQLLSLGDDQAERRRLSRQGDIAVLDLAQVDSKGPFANPEGWAGLVAFALASGKATVLAGPESLSASASREELDELGEELKAQLSGATKKTSRPTNGTPGNSSRLSSPPVTVAPSSEQPTPTISPDPTPALSATVRGDAPHPTFVGSQALTCATAHVTGPSASLQTQAQSPQVVEMLEHLDDMVYAAMAGDSDALAQVEVLWPLVLDELGPQLVDESREQYLRFALSIWTDFLAQPDGVTTRAAAALDVLLVLFGGEEHTENHPNS
jgi:hypothetical protein